MGPGLDCRGEQCPFFQSPDGLSPGMCGMVRTIMMLDGIQPQDEQDCPNDPVNFITTQEIIAGVVYNMAHQDEIRARHALMPDES
jgi:hypothetical protein